MYNRGKNSDYFSKQFDFEVSYSNFAPSIDIDL